MASSLKSQDELSLYSSELSLEEDDEEESELEDEYCNSDGLGDLELKNLDEDTCKFIRSIYFQNEAENNLEANSEGAMASYDLIQSSVENGAKKDKEEGNDDEDVEDDEDIDSEEEKKILLDIKDEIEARVREEIREELEGYDACIKALESDVMPEGEPDEDMDPKLKEAIIKMKKLDKILKKKVKQEREVKRERLLLERRIRKEIGELQQGGSHLREIKLNAEKFLSLELPQSHNEGVKIDEDETELPPVFQTQIDENTIKSFKHGSIAKKNSDEAKSSSRQSARLSTSLSKASKSQSKKEKNFIKRNKKLASEADEPVAMTDDEKKRLNELLDGIDDLPDFENLAEIEEGCFQLSAQPGEGFFPNSSEKMVLLNIHERLKQIMPEDEYSKVILNSERTSGQVTPQLLFTRVGIKPFKEVDPGEHALFETKEERELNARLLSIEKELEKFKVDQEMEDDLERHLTDEQLDQLLNDCVRNLSRTTYIESPELTSRSDLSSFQHFLDNPPKLTEEQLQQLLSEAHFPMSSKLLALREHNNEDEYYGTIDAATWKAIKEAQPVTEAVDTASNQQELITNRKAVTKSREQGYIILNKNMSANNESEPQKSFSFNPSKHNSQSFFKENLSSPLTDRSEDNKDIDLHYSSDPSCLNLFENIKRLPKISRSCTDCDKEVPVPRLNSSNAFSSQDSFNSELSLRLPQLSSSSCLIHAQQGVYTDDIQMKSSAKKQLSPNSQNVV